MPQAFALNDSPFQISLRLMDPLHGSHIFHILRRTVPINRLAASHHRLDHIIFQIPFHRFRNIIENPSAKDKNSRVNAVFIPVIPCIMLGIEPDHPILLIQRQKIRVIRMAVGVDKQSRRRLLFPVELHHPVKIDIKHQVAGHHEKFFVPNQIFQIVKRACCPQGLFFLKIPDPHAETASIAKIIPDHASQMSDHQQNILDPVFLQPLDLP